MEATATVIESKYLSGDPASEVVRAALDVHRSLGPGLAPELYQRALELELDERRLRYWRDVFVDLNYKGRRLGRSRVALVTGGVLVGIRVAPRLTEGDSALMSAQAKELGCTGLLLNFGIERLELRRIRPKRSCGGNGQGAVPRPGKVRHEGTGVRVGGDEGPQPGCEPRR